MFILVSPGSSGSPQVTVEESEDFGRLHVSLSRVPHEAAGKALTEVGAGRLEGEMAWVSVDFLRASCVDNSGRGRAGFEQMLKYADSKGWISQDASLVQAHVTMKAL